MLRPVLETPPTWATVPLRLALGVIFIAHGAQKVFGVWGGPGLNKWLSGTPPFGLRPAALWMGAAAFSELIGGLLVLLGLLTRLGALSIAAVMIVAMLGVHGKNGLFLSNQGFEYTLALLGMALALLIAGGGRLSADERLTGPPHRRR
ncbi:MAG TPA: DoxX family protein [Pyrinomonadaceae bacterium]|jgi:putative oxidoreductase|nr:DoxX family protein [Pyrinomonadaceae bacterium]